MIPDITAPGVAAALVLTALRVGGLLLVAPVWSAQVVPMRLRTAIMVIFAVILFPISTAGTDLESLRITPATFLTETIIGFIIGFAAALTIAAAEFAGELLTTSIGLNGAAIFDPVNNTQQPLLGQFLKMLALAILVIGGGHVVMLRALGDSFHALPLGGAFDLPSGFREFVPMARAIFATGLQFASPVIASIMVANIALAVLGRAAPQLNIMSLAFPLQIGIGLMTFAGSIALVVHGLADWTPGFAKPLDAFARAATVAPIGSSQPVTTPQRQPPPESKSAESGRSSAGSAPVGLQFLERR